MDRSAQEENEWIERSLQGDQQAYACLVQRYERMVRSVVRRLIVSDAEVDDLAQAAFVTAYENLAHYGAAARFSTWLCQIALNKCRDWLRARDRHRTNIDEDADIEQMEIGDPSDGPEFRAEWGEVDSMLQQALGQLRAGDREVIVLKYVEGHDYETIAQMLGCSADAAKLRSLRARDMLKRILVRMGVKP
ncbi:MAG TPA: sigma-70 family RNA polymerase sigma factor [Burkholderiales bacterium]|nr:sigma-70 family RNA polymerase sigma factor [Burkholderiales bacterium]